MGHSVIGFITDGIFCSIAGINLEDDWDTVIMMIGHILVMWKPPFHEPVFFDRQESHGFHWISSLG